jgi:hypothetical protein
MDNILNSICDNIKSLQIQDNTKSINIDIITEIMNDDFKQLAQLYVSMITNSGENFEFSLSNSNLTLFYNTFEVQQYYEYIVNNKETEYLEKILKTEIEDMNIYFIDDMLVFQIINEYIDYLECFCI